MARQSRLIAEEQGSSLIEVAACLSAVLMILFGIMDCSRALYADLFVGYAAHAASRYATVRGATWNGSSCSTSTTSNCAATSSDITRLVQSMAPLGVSTSTPLTVTSTWPGTNAAGSTCNSSQGANSPGCVVNVVVAYKFSFVLPFLPQNALLLSSSSTVTIAQ
jgi:Flp pilus assembly protein TadG